MAALFAGFIGALLITSHYVLGSHRNRQRQAVTVTASPNPVTVPSSTMAVRKRSKSSDPCQDICERGIADCEDRFSACLTSGSVEICKHLFWDSHSVVYRDGEGGLAPVTCDEAASVVADQFGPRRPDRQSRRRRVNLEEETGDQPESRADELRRKYNAYTESVYGRESFDRVPSAVQDEEIVLGNSAFYDDFGEFAEIVPRALRCIFHHFRTVLIYAMSDYPFPPLGVDETQVRASRIIFLEAIKDVGEMVAGSPRATEDIGVNFEIPFKTSARWRKAVGILVGSTLNDLGDVGFALEQLKALHDFCRIFHLEESAAFPHRGFLISENPVASVISALHAIQSTQTVAAPESEDEVAFHIQTMRQRIDGRSMAKKVRLKFPRRILQLFKMFQAIDPRHPSLELVADFCVSHGKQLVELLKRVAAMDEINTTMVSLDMVLIAKVCGSRLPIQVRAETIPALLHQNFKLYNIPPPQVESPEGDDDDDDDDESVRQETHWWSIRVSERDTSLFQNLRLLETFNRFDLMGIDFRVAFRDSESIGQGPTIAWLNRLMAQIFDPSNQFFTYSDERNLFMKPPATTEPSDLVPLEPHKVIQYRQIGRVLGLAIKHGVSPGVHLTRGCLEYLRTPMDIQSALPSGTPILEWLKEENPGIVTGLVAMETMDWADAQVVDAMSYLTFEGLMENGASININGENLQQYIWMKSEFVVLVSIQNQMESLVRGVYDVLPFNQLSILAADELGEMLTGSSTGDIDVDDLRSSATVTPATAAGSELIEWFWSIVESLDREDLVKFIEFVSGLSRPPLHGFTGIDGSKKWLSISVERGLLTNSLPLAQTCFQQIRIPRYSSKNKLKKRLLMAIRESDSLERK